MRCLRKIKRGLAPKVENSSLAIFFFFLFFAPQTAIIKRQLPFEAVKIKYIHAQIFARNGENVKFLFANDESWLTK